MSAPRPWRSLEHLAASPEFREEAAREFPEDASLPPEGVSRRDMLKLLGASLSLAGLTACRRPVEKIVPYVRAPEDLVPGVPRHYATTMPFGLSAYGLVVESHEGRPTKIEGNELHPSTRGSSSAVVQAALWELYDPDRSRAPRESGAPSTWEAFLAAWKPIHAGLAAARGEGLAVLSEPFCSPTLARLKAEFLGRFPLARWATYEPVGAENVHAGVRAVAGRVWRPVHHLDRAAVVLAIEADFLVNDPECIRHARGFADGRRLASPGDPVSRLYVVEATFTATGAMADHRAALRSSRMGAFVTALARTLAARGLPETVAGTAPRPEVLGIEPGWIEAVAEDLLANRGRGLILAGAHQPPELHAAVLALNSALGNLGSTVTLHEPLDASLPSRGELAELTAAMRQGSVRTLAILGGNPAYDAPADLDFSGALAKVETTIRLGAYFDETSRLARWCLPRAHFLESWGDARSADGTASVVQPLIAPLHGGRSAAELLHVMVTAEERPGHDLVRETWKPMLGEASFETAWNRVLHDGVLGGSATVPGAPEIAVPVRIPAMPGGDAGTPGLELLFLPSPALHDGRFANIAWLQELPDPATKITWDNAALVDPATARSLDLRNGDVVRLRARGRSLEMPVFVLPGQAQGTVAVALGYGRTAAGRVGDGVGCDTYRLRTSETAAIDPALEMEKTAATRALATTQDHFVVDELGIEERGRRVPTLVRQGTLEEYRRDPAFVAREEAPHPPLESLWQEHAYDRSPQWGMTIDLNACVGCNGCVIACQVENNVPAVGRDQVARGREMHWIRVDRYFTGSPERPSGMVFQPVTCMHCENAPCEQVCPVAATVHDEQGLNTMVYNRCIGTRYCANNCPYKVRRFNFYNFTKDTPELLQMAANPDVTVRSRGVMEKCTFCVQRINRARLDAKLAGREPADGDVLAACQQACPSRAIAFGDIRDPGSRVARLRAESRSYVLLEELNNRPRTSYLARIRNPHPTLEES